MGQSPYDQPGKKEQYETKHETIMGIPDREKNPQRRQDKSAVANQGQEQPEILLLHFHALKMSPQGFSHVLIPRDIPQSFQRLPSDTSFPWFQAFGRQGGHVYDPHGLVVIEKLERVLQHMQTECARGDDRVGARIVRLPHAQVVDALSPL